MTNDLRCGEDEQGQKDYRILIRRRSSSSVSDKMQVERKQKKETRLRPWAVLAEMLEADNGVVIAAQCSSYPSLSGRTDDQCSLRAKTSETRHIEVHGAGPGEYGGLAAVS
jgi:hypothetical protein